MRGIAVLALAVAGSVFLGAGSAPAGTFPGANGKIAFDGSDGTDDEIFTMNPDGTGLTPLTSNSPSPGDFAGDSNASFSADGERIAFERFFDTGAIAIHAMNADGSNEVEVTGNSVSDGGLSLSPDGRRIAFVRTDATPDNEIFVVDADGSNPAPLTSNAVPDRLPSWSPDGQRIVFARGNEPQEIFVMDADGQNQTPLTNNAVNDDDPSWSPDGQRIVFVRDDDSANTDIFVMDADGQNQVPLTTTTPAEEGGPSWSPDGQRIAYERDGQIFVMDADGQNQAPLTSGPLLTDDDPAWQPLNPPRCDLTAEEKQRSFKVVSATITCTNENATVIVGGSGKAPKVAKVSVAVASKAKPLTLGS